MRLIQLGPLARARVWLGELPEFALDRTHFITRTIEADPLQDTRRRRGAIELYIPKGPRAWYGLLGAEFIPAPSQHLSVEVAVTEAIGVPISWSLAARIDEVQVGMPAEYAESVLDGAYSSDDIRSFGTGSLRFEQAAHGMAGSSRAMFRLLASLVVSLLARDDSMMSDADVATFLRQGINNAGSMEQRERAFQAQQRR